MAPEMSNIDVKLAKALPASSHSPYMTNAVLIHKRRNLNTIARSSEKCHLTTATATATVVLIGDDVLTFTQAAELFHLSSEAEAAQDALLRGLQTVCRVYIEKFCNLLKTHKLKGGEDQGESVDLLLCDPPYIFHR